MPRFGKRSLARLGTIVGVALSLAPPVIASGDAEVSDDANVVVRTIRARSAEDVARFYDTLDYNADHIPEILDRVPRAFFTAVPDGWREANSVPLRKSVFFRSMLPLILRANELILADRARLDTIRSQGSPSMEDQRWVHELAVRYRVIDLDEVPTMAVYEELLRRVDAVPPSLALAQSAVESGWGSSRFAREGNALFGQWSWGQGMEPGEAKDADYRVAAFPSPLASAQSYAMNLNTHRAYSELRDARARQRMQGKTLDGLALVPFLRRYAEDGDAYIETLTELITYNQIMIADAAVLDDGPEYDIVPIDGQAEAP